MKYSIQKFTSDGESHFEYFENFEEFVMTALQYAAMGVYFKVHKADEEI